MRKNAKDIYASSLLDLLQKSSYDVITTSEICDNTPLTRRTFYNNFTSKKDVAQFICDKLMEEYLEILRKEQSITHTKGAEIFCRFGASKKEIFTLLIQNNLYYMIAEAGIKNAEAYFALYPNDIFGNLNKTQRNYILKLYSVCAVNLFEQWLIGGMKESPEEMSRIYASFVRDSYNLSKD